MGRWEPGGSSRLREAALELFLEQGFDETTAGEIAQRVGLSERTFFRHFGDKKEVLFGGSEEFQREMIAAVADAPEGPSPLGVVASGLAKAARFFPDEARDYSRKRWRILGENPALQERELLKMAAIASGIGAVLRDRGVPEPAATLAAESGITVFRLAFERWLAPDEHRPLAEIERAMFVELGAVVAGS
ncbi:MULTISPECIES: TetR family transcriptional regulator [unclassified Frondihabitans]|jgi:AcrR family transcriptional regulator|uniref:TetR family transcriptional regulator n=1 Tax=unclassified Frondihabitans TaxID=2626248 RepID=UPI000F4F8115|nr:MULTISPECIES: TetR family transcriptional regulator [unclassified Frondihabitans]RPE78653.1 TetR family transcriptional regulator [Frondihabitans sp. PhB153]RPF08934.1 TetR family transcriptional regulator [Frondihabitans sp. PhB161]